MTKQAHVSGRLMAHLASYYPDTCLIEDYTASLDNIGEETTVTWATVTGMSAIPCRLWPLVGTEEAKSTQETTRVQSHAASLQGEWAITTRMRATIAGQVFDILTVQTDSEHMATHIALQQVTT